MLTLILLIILIVSFSGIMFMIVKKMPALKAIESTDAVGFTPNPLRQKISQRIKESDFIKGFSTEKVIKKICLQAKIFFLKGEKRMDKYLHKISHSQKFEDDYWGEINKKKK